MIRKSILCLCLLPTIIFADVVSLTSNNFEKLVLKSKNPSVVLFKAAWCGVCERAYPVYDGMSTKFKSIPLQFYSVDTDAANDLAAKYKIREIPTYIFFKNGHPSSTETGAKNNHALAVWINKNLK